MIRTLMALALVFTLPLTLGSTAQAEGMNDKMDKMMDPMAMNDASWKNFYLHGALGYAKYDLNQEDVNISGLSNANRHSADDDDFAFRVGLGYDINDVFAVEFGLANLGSPVVTNVAAITPNASGTLTNQPNDDYDQVIDLSATANLTAPETSAVTPYLRFGIASFDGDNYNNDIQPLVGFGIEYANFRFEISRYDLEPEPVDTFFVGYKLSFGMFSQ